MAPGVFTLSLDMELAWGSFDTSGIEHHEPAYRRTPDVIERLCTLFDEYEVSATWAIVTHLLDECEGVHRAEPTGRGKWLANAPCTADVDRSLWYAPELGERIQDCTTEQDVGVHGYSHLIFSEHTREAAAVELSDAVDAARDAGLDPVSFVYPRNQIAHTDLLAEYGFEVYRGVDARWYEQRSLPVGRRPLRFLDEAGRFSPPTIVPDEHDGLVRLPGSQIFRPVHGAWAFAPGETQVSRAKKGLDRAAARGEVFHLWFHPFNFARDPETMLTAFKAVLKYADELRADGRLEIRSMREVGALSRKGRWHAPDSNRDS